MKTQSKNKVKKISQGHYIYKGLQIVLAYGDSQNYWNIFMDEDLSIEWQIGVHTKWQCIEAIDTYYN